MGTGVPKSLLIMKHSWQAIEYALQLSKLISLLRGSFGALISAKDVKGIATEELSMQAFLGIN